MQQITLTENTVLEIINAKNETYTGYVNYNSSRQGWFLDLVSENFKIYGLRITSVPNILKQWKNKLGFGIGVLTENNSEPLFLEDFNTERAKMFLLDQDDLALQEIMDNEQI